MMQRVRDFKRNIRPQQQISYDDWQLIVEKWSQGKAFLKETNSVYILMQEDLKKAEDIILTNRIHDVHENRKVSDILRKVFITPREEQLNELVGQVKYIRGVIAEANSWVMQKEELEKLEADDQITIDKNIERKH